MYVVNWERQVHREIGLLIMESRSLDGEACNPVYP